MSNLTKYIKQINPTFRESQNQKLSDILLQKNISDDSRKKIIQKLGPEYYDVGHGFVEWIETASDYDIDRYFRYVKGKKSWNHPLSRFLRGVATPFLLPIRFFVYDVLYQRDLYDSFIEKVLYLTTFGEVPDTEVFETVFIEETNVWGPWQEYDTGSFQVSYENLVIELKYEP